MARYKDIGEGWVQVAKRGFRLRCCSCGLIHTIDFRIQEDRIEIRMERHERATKAARRAIQKRVVIVDD